MPDREDILVQDKATNKGLGDSTKKFGQAGQAYMDIYKLESQIEDIKKSQAGAGKAAQAKLMETYGGVLSKPYEEFKPSQESLGGFAALGSLLMVAGAMMGGKGRLSGIGAMNNIAGMMKGYQEGRKDLYEQERKQFEENMKTFEKNRGMIKEAFDRALKIAPTNLKLANDMLRRDLQALGATVPAEMVGKSGAVQAAGSYGNFHSNTSQTLTSLQKQLGQLKAEREAHKLDIEAAKTDKRENFLNQKTGKVQYLLPSEAAKNPDLIAVGTGYATAEMRIKSSEKMQKDRIDAAQKRTERYLSARNTATPDDIEANAQMVAHNSMKLTSVPSQTRQAVASRAKEINPAWSEADYGNQQIAYRNWVQPNGFGAKQISAFSTVAQHLELMDELKTALDNNDQPAVNQAVNYFRTQLGHPEVTNFNTARQAVAAELVRAYSGTAGALDDRKTADALMSPNLSPEQIDGVLNTAKDLVGARLYTAKSMYESGTGRTDFETLLPPPIKRMFGDYIKDKGTPVQGGAGKLTAEQRFNELIEQGVSEDEAYNTLRQEGYK